MQTTLGDLDIGDSGVIDEIGLPVKLQRRLQDMGLVKGTEVRLLRRAPLGDPIEIEVRGYRLALRKSDARHISFSEVRTGCKRGQKP